VFWSGCDETISKEVTETRAERLNDGEFDRERQVETQLPRSADDESPRITGLRKLDSIFGRPFRTDSATFRAKLLPPATLSILCVASIKFYYTP